MVVIRYFAVRVTCRLVLLYLLFIFDELLELYVEVSLGFVCQYLLHHSCPCRTVAGAFVFEDAHELHGAIDYGEIVCQVELAHVGKKVAVDDFGKEDSHDEHGEVLHHLGHFL